ncbi:U-box domain-containing protein 21 [Senna tora]|uniref:U-box domain-containing protein 21 n=1 Tax=Senna tora TaxID=362788 RepID=A0A834TI07_9FABA|nr:U-box domain-containing protein 21 [Senna tora]
MERRQENRTCPVAKITGSLMRSFEMGHRNSGGIDDKGWKLWQYFKSLRVVIASAAVGASDSETPLLAIEKVEGKKLKKANCGVHMLKSE